jgi:DNA-binding SARP family transcriptional activator
MTSPGVLLQLTGATGWRSTTGRAGHLSRKDAALLALLAFNGATPRDRVAALLWPDASTLKAYNSLRQRLFRLRRDTGHELALLGDTVSLAPGVHTDLADDASQAGELLGAFDYGDSHALDEWVQSAREQWRQRRVDALTGVAARHEAAGAWAAAIACTQRLIEIAPLQEHAWRRLMRLNYLRGDRAAALAAFEIFEARLKDELGARPSAETLEQLQLIETPVAPPPAGPRRLLPASLLRPPRVVGRTHEMRTLQAAWEAGQAVVLVGAAGMGKSRLLDDFLAGREHVVLEQGRPGDERSPYATASRWMAQVLALHPGACGPAQHGEMARLLPALGTVPRGPGHQGALWHAVEDVLAGAQAQGLAALVVDDLQFADGASVELLRWLLPSQRLHGLRFALATRPAGDTPRGELLAQWWADSRRPETVVLKPLGLGDVRELLATLALPELPTELAADLLSHTGGKPFFVLETLKALVLHGPPSQGLPRPASVRTLIDRRLQRLPADALGLMRLAAVAHQDLTVERAAQILGTSILQLAEPWALLEAADVLQGTRFTHDLMRDAALAQVPTPVSCSWPRARPAAGCWCPGSAPRVPP